MNGHTLELANLSHMGHSSAAMSTNPHDTTILTVRLTTEEAHMLKQHANKMTDVCKKCFERSTKDGDLTAANDHRAHKNMWAKVNEAVSDELMEEAVIQVDYTKERRDSCKSAAVLEWETAHPVSSAAASHLSSAAAETLHALFCKHGDLHSPPCDLLGMLPEGWRALQIGSQRRYFYGDMLDRFILELAKAFAAEPQKGRIDIVL